MKQKIVTWVVIADGARARILQQNAPGKHLVPLPDMEFSQDRLLAGDIMADKPGRAFKTGGARAAMQPRTDPVAKREADFVRALAATLEDKRRAGVYDQLVIFAAPRAMGDLRPALTEATRKVILAEIPKDLTQLPNPKITKYLEGVMVF